MGRSPIPAGSRDTRTPGVTNRLLLSHSSGRAFSGFPMRKAVEKAQAFLSEMILTHSGTSALVLGSEDMFRDTSCAYHPQKPCWKHLAIVHSWILLICTEYLPT